MSIYWSLKSVPELAPLTGKQRRRVHEHCIRRHFWFARATRRSVFAYLAFLFTVVVFMAGGDTILRALGVAHRFWITLVLAYIGFFAANFIFSRIAIPLLRPFYQEFIQRDETPVV